MAGLNFPEFLAKTGLSIPRLATYLQVAESYLEAAAAGTARLTARDQQACRLLLRRLVGATQLELPLSAPVGSLTRAYARQRKRERAVASQNPRARQSRAVRARIASGDRASDQKGTSS
jgi:hypothetical protein